MIKYLSFLILIVFSGISCTNQNETLETVAEVDLSKYAGKWYEISSFPQKFQKGCHCTTATYTPTDQGYVVVENKCNKGGITGPESYIQGKAFILENSGNSKLEVQFFWPFKGDYWIIDLAPDYTYAVVGHPSRDYLWILSRTPSMEEEVYSSILKNLQEKRFDISRLVKTVQC